MTKLSVSDLIDGSITERTSTSLVVNTGDGYLERFSGTGFTYGADGAVTGGSITSFRETLNGSTTFTIGELNYSAATFYQQASTGNTAAALTQIFSGDDNLFGGNLNDGLVAFAGNDNLYGGSGTDSLSGGDGADHIYGQSSNGGVDSADLILGGGGGDYLQGNAGADTIDGGADSDRINGGADGDTIFGGQGADTINGNRGNDVIDAGDNDDIIRGGQDNDLLSGGQGFDILQGDLGADTIVGGSGLDLLTGGDGSDLFRFASGDSTLATSGTYSYIADVVADFANGTDKLTLGFAPAAILTDVAQASVAAALATARSLFDGRAGDREVAALQVGSDTYLFFNGSGGGSVDSAITLTNLAPSVVDTTDFV
jgi:Ca2+-binding RTX toxin-like protein